MKKSGASQNKQIVGHLLQVAATAFNSLSTNISLSTSALQESSTSTARIDSTEDETEVEYEGFEFFDKLEDALNNLTEKAYVIFQFANTTVAQKHQQELHEKQEDYNAVWQQVTENFSACVDKFDADVTTKALLLKKCQAAFAEFEKFGQEKGAIEEQIKRIANQLQESGQLFHQFKTLAFDTRFGSRSSIETAFEQAVEKCLPFVSNPWREREPLQQELRQLHGERDLLLNELMQKTRFCENQQAQIAHLTEELQVKSNLVSSYVTLPLAFVRRYFGSPIHSGVHAAAPHIRGSILPTISTRQRSNSI